MRAADIGRLPEVIDLVIADIDMDSHRQCSAGLNGSRLDGNDEADECCVRQPARIAGARERYVY